MTAQNSSSTVLDQNFGECWLGKDTTSPPNDGTGNRLQCCCVEKWVGIKGKLPNRGPSQLRMI
uniref:Uncharacterized protein n=1 Tax=Arion vulgaris TaxID=1028688 RepID=A0A0B7A5A4_9EUPU